MRKNSVRILVFILGIGLCVYPTIASCMAKKNQGNIISTYKNKVKSTNKKELEEIYNNAENYNALLFQNTGKMLGQNSSEEIKGEEYEKLLNFSKDGVMGFLSIPKIGVKLPIYHGTEEAVLVVGAGHLEGTSLPVGGENTHCVLTGHRGLPGAKLFTRLDELEENDLFFVHVGERELVYSVCEIDVIEPENVERFTNKGGNDLVSLVTCTPYGVNSHRLVVTGQRIESKLVEREEIKAKVMSGRELLFIVIPLVSVGMFLTKIIRERRARRSEE